MKRIVLGIVAVAMLGTAATAKTAIGGQDVLQQRLSALRLGGMIETSGQGVSSLDELGGVNVDSISSIGLGGTGFNVDLVGTLAYVAASSDGGLRIIDVSNPALPTEVGSNDTLSAFDVDVVGNYAFVADGNGFLYVVDVSDPSDPYRVANVSTSADPVLTVDVFGDYAYCGSSSGTLRIFDISTPTSPSLTGSLQFDSQYAYNTVVQGDTAYVASGTYPFDAATSALRIVNVSDRSNPSLIASVDFNPGYLLNWVAMDGKLAYCGYGHAFDPLYGVVVIDVTDPVNWSTPVEYLMTDQVTSIVLQDTFAVVSMGYSGVEVLNIANAHLGTVLPAGSYPLSGYTTGMAVDSSLIFQTNGDNLTILDASAAGLGGVTVDPAVVLSVSDVDASAFPVIDVAVLVTDESSVGVTGLNEANFSLDEDEVGQTISGVFDLGFGLYTVSYTTANTTEDGSLRAVSVNVDYNSLSDTADSSYTAPFTADPPTLDIGEEYVVVGDTIAVPVTVTDFNGVHVIELYIDFDTTKLTFDTLTSDFLDAPVFNEVDGTVIVSWFSTTSLEIADDDTLLNLHFIGSGITHDEETLLSWNEDSYIADVDAIVISDATYLTGSVTGIGVFSVNGFIRYYSSDIALEGATVSMSGDTTLALDSGVDGSFTFSEILLGSYTLSVSMDDEGHPGVNTLDAYRIQQSVETINPFTSGYELYASDVNMTDNVNTLDAYKIQRVVVGLDADFAAGDWGFIGTDYAMNTDNWADATTSRTVEVASADVTDQNFYGFRFGDANGTWPSSFLPDPRKTDDELTGSLMLTEAVVSPGGIATVELNAVGLSDLGVIEWHIAFDPTVVTLQDFYLPELGGAVTSTTDSTISVSWFNISSAINCEDQTLGSFTFQAVNEVNVQSDLVLYDVVLGDVNGIELWTEEIDGSIMVSDLADVNYQGAAIVTDWALHPAYPNPFNAYTTLSFDVKETSAVQIHVYNILGDLVATLVDGTLPKGRYASSVNAHSWSSGTYFVVMQTSRFNKVQKIVLLK